MPADDPAPIGVMYVDGDAVSRETVRECLEGEDGRFTVLTAPDRVSAGEALHSEDIDCVVSVQDLPDGTGLELLETVGWLRPAHPFVLYPADGSEHLAARAIEAGVSGYQPQGSVAETCEQLAETVESVVTERTEQQAAFDRMTDAFFAVDDEWRFTYLNERGRAIIREAMPADRREAIETLGGESLWEVVPAAVDTTFYEKYHEAMETQEPVTFEDDYAPLDTLFEVRAYPSESGLSVYFRDITDHREYERVLEHRESVLTRMYRIVADNEPAFEEKLDRLFSIGRQELDVEYATLSHVEDGEYTFEYVQAPDGNDAIAAGDVVPLSWTSCERAVTSRERLVVSDMDAAQPEIADREGNRQLGLECYLGTPVVVDGAVYGTFCFYGSVERDEPFSQWQITLVDLMGSWVSYEFERQHREEELTHERNRLEEFASVVSHDLRNPLNIAVSNLELARDECDSEYLDGVASGLDRMETLIEDVLALTRLGGQVVDQEPIDLSDLVRAAWRTVSDDAGHLLVDDATIVGDERRLQRLFENLLRNALDHGGESVTVRVGLLSDGHGFYVEDDGPGISEDEREEVFEHGYTTAQEGTGFGLAIVKEIVVAHGGSITVTESDDGGARFEISGIDVR